MRRALAVALALALAACATGGGPRPVPGTHTLIPGTRISIAVPPGFHHDPSLPGYESADGRTALFANEVPGSVYATLRGFSGEAFQKNGMRLHEQERVTVDGWPARLFRASQPVPGDELGRWVLVFGDASVSVVMTAVMPEGSWAEASEPLREALLSVRWHKDGVPAPAPTAH